MFETSRLQVELARFTDRSMQAALLDDTYRLSSDDCGQLLDCRSKIVKVYLIKLL